MTARPRRTLAEDLEAASKALAELTLAELTLALTLADRTVIPLLDRLEAWLTARQRR